jgi:predicted Zn-dependent protease
MLSLALSCAIPFLSFAHGDLHEVIEGVSRAISNAPEDATLYFRRAELLRLHQSWAEAEADYAKAETLAPSMNPVKLGRAQVRLAQGDEEGALQLLDEFLSARPGHPEGRMLRARLLEKNGEWQKADLDLAVAVESSPEPHYASLRAELLQRQGQTGAAVRCLDETSARLGRVPVLEQQALAIEEQAGFTDAALSRLDGFIAREPRPDIWLARKAHLLEKAGRTEEAQTAWYRASAAFEKIPSEKRSLEINRKLADEIAAAKTDKEKGRP